MVRNRRIVEKKKKRISKLLPQKPKKPSSGFGAFLREFWPSLARPDRTRQSLRDAATQWRALTPQQKDRYREMVAADRTRYDEQMTLWKRQKAFLTRPASMYAMFVKEVWQRERNNNTAGLSIRQVATMASAEWRALTPEARQPYTDRYTRARQNYVLSIRDFKAGLAVNLDRQLDTTENYVPLLPPQPNEAEFEFDENEEDFGDDDDVMILDDDAW